ncbi:NTE family protein [Desulfonatronum zhilinae]|nr:NTE family protein [Desulfonatronum zhilinae]
MTGDSASSPPRTPRAPCNLDDLRSAGLGLVLGGGAARGFAHIGFLQELIRAELRPACLAGSSIGAFIGAAYAGGDWPRFVDRALTLQRLDLLRMIDPVLLKCGLMDGDKILEFLAGFLRVKNLEECDPPLAVNATDATSGEEVVITSGPIIPAVRASIALPGMFTPGRVGDRLLLDGGLINPLPVNICRGMGAEVVMAVDLNAHVLETGGCSADSATDRKPGLISVLIHSMYIMQRTVNLMRLEKEPPDFLIQPELRDFRLLDFFKGPACSNAGARAARAFLHDLECPVQIG